MTTIDLGDARRNRRAQQVLGQLGDKPRESIPSACGGWTEARAAYRLFDRAEVTAEKVLAPHIACTVERLREHPRVLCIQDTSELDYTGKTDIQDLGPLNYETRRGLYLHPTLAVTPNRLCLGVLDIYSWAREPGSLGQEKDSDRPDRVLTDIEVTAILATEPHPPPGEEPVEWLLLTNLPVETPEQALEKLQWYLCRWQIEIYFRILKSGCRIEALQLEKLERLEPALAFYMIIAWRVLFLTMLGRECPEMPCDVVFDTAEWQAVYLVTQRQPPPDTPPSLDQMVRMIAGLGGFLDRKCDGFPGPQTLWIGLQRAADFVLALEAQRSIAAAGDRERYDST